MKIKNVNDVMIFCLEDMLFQDFLVELDKLLDQAIFNNDCFYPKAFFDLNHRKLDLKECQNLIDLLKKKEKVLFCGMSLDQQDEYILLNNDVIRNGEEIFVNQKTVFTNKINQGSRLYCLCDTYFIDEVKGTIILLDENVRLFVNHSTHATFMINHKILYNVTTFAPVYIYYDGNDIVCKREESDYESNHCIDIG